MNSNKILGAIFLSISASIWGGMFVVVKVVVEYIPPVELVWLRYLIALFFLVIFGLIRGIKWRIARQDLFLIFFFIKYYRKLDLWKTLYSHNEVS